MVEAGGEGEEGSENKFTEYLRRNYDIVGKMVGVSEDEIVRDSAKMWGLMNKRYREYLGGLC